MFEIDVAADLLPIPLPFIELTLIADGRGGLSQYGSTSSPHDGALEDMVCAIGGRLFAAEVLAGLNTRDLANVDLDAAKRMARQALTAIDEDRLGYVILCAVRP